MYPTKTAALAFGCTLVFTACTAPGNSPSAEAEQSAPSRSAQEVQTQFDTLRSTWQTLANENRFGELAQLFAEDAVLVDVYGNVHEGRAAIEGVFRETLPAVAGVTLEQTEVVVHGELAAGQGIFTRSAEGPCGPLETTGRWMTLASYGRDGAMRIRMHQSMLPAPDQRQGGDPSAELDFCLTDDSLGPLRLERGMTVSVAEIAALFPSFETAQRCFPGAQAADGSSRCIISVSSGGGQLFTITSEPGTLDGAVDWRVAYLTVLSPEIPDVHGIRVGDTYADVVSQRGTGLQFGAAHHGVFTGRPNIFYNLAVPCVVDPRLGPNACVDRDPTRVTREDAAGDDGFRVISISWPGAIW